MSIFEDAMREALALARQGMWKTAPNPMVGAVLVRQGEIVAKGWHSARGQAHAEVACLENAQENGIDPAECTLVVTLEPCNHEGLTPPCTQAILSAGIKHVVVGTSDPNPQASGGAEALRQAGVQVDMGILEEECQELIADFKVWQSKDRPYLILKMATSLDGYAATRLGQSKYISNERSLAWVAKLREGVGQGRGAILVGSNTFFTDNPRLTARTESAQVQPLAAVVLSRMPSPDHSSYLLQERAKECILFSSAAQAASPHAAGLREMGARIYGLDRARSGFGLDLVQLLKILRHEENCHYVLCEGGGRMAYSLLRQDMVDEFHLFLTPLVIADPEAKPMFQGNPLDNLSEAFRMRLKALELFGQDVHLHYQPIPKSATTE